MKIHKKQRGEYHQKKKKFFSDWELGDVDSLLQMVVRDGVGDNLR